MLTFPVGLCVSECVSLCLCFSVPAFECCMILFTYNLSTCIFFFTYCFFEYIHLSVSSSWMFNVCEFLLWFMLISGQHYCWRPSWPGDWAKNSSWRFPASETTSDGPLHWSVWVGGWRERRGGFLFYFFSCHRTEAFVALLKPSWASLCLQITTMSIKHAHALHYLNISLILQRLLWCNKLTLFLNRCTQLHYTLILWWRIWQSRQ